MVKFDEILDTCSAEALQTKFEPTGAYVWRKLCRTYSKKFYTPLHDVLLMDPEVVATNVFEDNLDELELDENIEQLLDLIYSLGDPDYDKSKSEELEEFIRQAKKQDDERRAANRPIHPSMVDSDAPRKITPEKEVEHEPTLPTQGGINLSYLENSDNER